MKKNYHLLLLAILLTSPWYVHGQSLMEKLGGVKTNFVISSNNQLFDVINQGILPRGMEEHKNYGSDGWGLGTTTLHLEFIAFQQPKLIYQDGRGRRFYIMEIFDQENNKVAELELGSSRVKIVPATEKQERFIYSINLLDVPLISFDNAYRINIVEVQLKRL